MDTLAQLLPLLLIAAVFWLLVIRPQRRRQQQMTTLQENLGVGTRVMLTSGIFGTVVTLADETVDVEVAPGTVLTVVRAAIGRTVEPDVTPDTAPGVAPEDTDRPTTRSTDE